MSKRSMAMLIFLFWFPVLATGCARGWAHLIDARDKEEGLRKVYSVNMDQAWKIAKTALRWGPVELIEENRDEGYMRTTTFMSSYDPGTMVGVWIKPVGENQTEVYAVSVKRDPLGYDAFRETKFHENFALGVELVKKGKPLPSIRPKSE